MTTTCPSCGAPAAGKFCAECGASLQGASCAACHVSLTPGARFCHRCGTPVGGPRSAPPDARPSGVGSALPWAVAAIALLALIALAAGQRFGRPPQNAGLTTPMGTPLGADGGQRAPDISAMSPTQRAERRYDRVMSAAERGLTDSVQFFMPMALQSYLALGELSVDQRYDLGRLAEVAGDAELATAQADTILRQQPRHLLGLILASRAARLRKDERAANRYLEQFAAAEAAERRKQLPEYLLHQNDIESTLAEYRRGASR